MRSDASKIFISLISYFWMRIRKQNDNLEASLEWGPRFSSDWRRKFFGKYFGSDLWYLSGRLARGMLHGFDSGIKSSCAYRWRKNIKKILSILDGLLNIFTIVRWIVFQLWRCKKHICLHGQRTNWARK